MKPSQTNFKGLDRSIRMQKIVEAATSLFQKKGFKATTLEEVAKELSLTKAALYHYIPGKEKLLSIIYGQAFEKIFHRIYRDLGAGYFTSREAQANNPGSYL